MERFLFRRIEVWIVLLLGLVVLLGLIGFGTVVRSEVMGYNKYGVIGRVAITLAELPITVRRMLTETNPMAVGEQRFEGRPGGWHFAEGTATPQGYVLLSRFDGDARMPVVELFDLEKRETLHRWWPDSDTLLDGTRVHEKFSQRLTRSRYRAIHPLLMQNGDLVFKDHDTPLVRMDACSRLVWNNDETTFHHSSERAGDGSIWVPNHNEPHLARDLPAGYVDDGLVRVAPDGTLLEAHSVTRALVDAGYAYLIFPTTPVRQSRDSIDMIHVNDIQPVLQDGPHWKAGDLFVSTRHYSMVMLYRPSERRIIWMQNGPWASQHDVDILNDHTIAIFNNSVYNRGITGRVEGVSEILTYDFDTGRIASPFRDLFERENISTLSGGLFDMMPGGGVMIEEENHGRIVIADRHGTVQAEFINRAGDGVIYHPGWSRYVPRAEGDAALRNLARADCGQPT